MLIVHYFRKKGSKEKLDTEQKMMERIRGFAYLARLEGAAALGCALKK